MGECTVLPPRFSDYTPRATAKEVPGDAVEPLTSGT